MKTNGSIRKVSSAKIEQALRASGGVMAVAAKMVGLSRQTVFHRIKAEPRLAAALEDVRETTLDIAEGQLLKAIKRGELKAVIFYLLAHGKHRGYVLRAKVEPEVAFAPVAIYLPAKAPLPDDEPLDTVPSGGIVGSGASDVVH